MLQSLKQKTLISKLWLIIVLAVASIACAVYFGPSFIMMVQGPTYFEPLDDNEISALQGKYLAAYVDTIIDYYAETVRSETGKLDVTTSRDYIMPINTTDGYTVYVGLEVPKSKLADADAVVDDTAVYLADEDGSYEWDGSYVEVRGTLKPMDSETEGLYRDYLSDMGIDDDMIGMDADCTFLPLVLVDGDIGVTDGGYLPVMMIVLVVLLAVLVFIIVRCATGSYQKQIRNYIAKSADPQGTEQALDRFYEDTMQEGKVRIGRDWLMYINGGSSWVLAGDDVVWAYQYTLRRKMYGVVTVGKDISVRVFSATEKKAQHDIPVHNEEAAKELLQDLQNMYPNAMIGYDADMERRYNADPVGFHKAVVEARRQPAAPAEPEAQPAEPAQV